ncbi:MAG: hypothetical protein O3C40_30235 [Planctomycetota bacterium]|nr:hypothetical protein [Planctomycetota bacterium]
MSRKEGQTNGILKDELGDLPAPSLAVGFGLQIELRFNIPAQRRPA